MNKITFNAICFFLILFLLGVSQGIATENKLPDSLTTSDDPPVSVQINVLFISIEKYELAPLDYASNDIEKFSTLLQTLYGCKSRAIVDYPRSQKVTGQPEFYRDAIKKEIQNWAQSLSRSETGILYLAGHGLKDSEGRLCLPMINFNRKNYKEATIPLIWIRDVLDKTDAKCKLILLDTCFSGTSKAYDDFSVSNAAQMAKAFSNLTNSATLASSTDSQKSWIWSKMKHSLFTFWLIEAFRGNADVDNNRIITLDELYQYVLDNVSWVSRESEDMEEQSPELLNQDQIKKSFEIPIPQINLSEVISNIASQVDLKMMLSNLHNILVPEFVTSEEGDNIKAEYGTLPKSVASKLIMTLNRNNRKTYTVYNENAVRELLNRKGIIPADLGTSKTTDLKMAGKTIEVAVRGRINMFHANAVTITVELINLQTQETIGSYGGTALLSASEMGMAGASFVIGENRIKIKKDPAKIRYRKVEELNMYVASSFIQDLQKINIEKKKPHPILSQSHPWQVQIMVRSKGSNNDFMERTGCVIDNSYYVPLDKNEEYAICLTNNGENDIWAKVMVDGRNTISQNMSAVSKHLTVVEVPNGKNVVAPRVDLEDATAWMLYGKKRDYYGNEITDPNQMKSKKYIIQGYYDTSSNQNSTLYPFVLTDADKAIKNRNEYTDQIGLITVAFCESVPARGTRGIHQDLKTELGEGVKVELQTDKSGTCPGEIFAICNIRYISQKLYKKLTEHNAQDNDN